MRRETEISCRLRQHRLIQEMTQQEVAERVGVTRQTILSIEKGKYTPSVALALRLAALFSVSVEDLFHLSKGEDDDRASR